MIKGIGTDLVEIARIAAALERTPRMHEKVLSPQEIAVMQTIAPAHHTAFMAKRFAAKEAFAKATGLGVREAVQLRYISVLNDEHGKPYFAFAPELQQWLDAQAIMQADVSLSDTKTHALAFVVLSGH